MNQTMESGNLIPLRRAQVQWHYEADRIIIAIHRDRSMDKVLRLLYRTPRTITLELEGLGKRVWELCDGNHNIEGIAQTLQADFGEAAEPVLPRLWAFLGQLRARGLIEVYRHKEPEIRDQGSAMQRQWN